MHYVRRIKSQPACFLIYLPPVLNLDLQSIDFSLLKEKYHPHRSEAATKIRACCGEIEECTNANINVDIPKRSDRSQSELKFEIQGQGGAVQNAVQNLKQEFIIREVSPMH